MPTLAQWGDRFAGFALLMAALFAWRARTRADAAAADPRRPMIVGLVHGVSGAGSLLLVLPMLVVSFARDTLSFLGAYSLGSTLAMAALTTLIAKLGAGLSQRVLERSQTAMMLAAGAVGAYWLIA